MVETFTPKIELIDPTTLAFRTRRAQHLPCFLLDTHSVNEDFRGREDILKLLAAKLLPSTNKVAASTPTLRQFALCGFGGIGKTEIAREFVRRHLSYFDAVFWVKADEVANLDLGYKRISLALRLEEEFECKSRVVSNEIVKRWLSNPLDDSWMRKNVDPFVPTQQATWLLVFDNANDPTILADYWPQGSGSILVTSRDPLAKSMFTNRCSGLDIDPFSQQDSLSLINNLTGMANELEDDTARKISDALGGIPLAISQMAGIIRRWGLTLAEFLELYNDDEERSKLYRTKFDTHLVPYCHSLSTVWAFDKLRDDARLLLEVISFFDSDVIREDLLIEASAMLLPEHSQFKKWHYIEARTDLLQASLIHRDKQKQSLSVHRTVQDVMFARISLAKKRFMFDLVVRILWENWPSAMPKPSKKPKLPQPKAIGSRLHVGRWPICAVAYPHVLKIHRLWSTIPGLSEATKLIFAKLLLEAAWCVYNMHVIFLTNEHY